MTAYQYHWFRTDDLTDCNRFALKGWRVVPGIMGAAYDYYPSVLMERELPGDEATLATGD